MLLMADTLCVANFLMCFKMRLVSVVPELNLWHSSCTSKYNKSFVADEQAE